ncbi:MAG: helix-turn-helix domain-containing protein [Ruminococcus flavefaciens]|nr:helix-turn-helix domain-containing protein [Ruminococcus flavefaciens]
MRFSERLKYFRLENGYSQEEFARLIGVNRSNISRYENGETVPDMFKGVKIAALMGITCEELVTETFPVSQQEYAE